MPNRMVAPLVALEYLKCKISRSYTAVSRQISFVANIREA